MNGLKVKDNSLIGWTVKHLDDGHLESEIFSTRNELIMWAESHWDNHWNLIKINQKVKAVKVMLCEFDW